MGKKVALGTLDYFGVLLRMRRDAIRLPVTTLEISITSQVLLADVLQTMERMQLWMGKLLSERQIGMCDGWIWTHIASRLM